MRALIDPGIRPWAPALFPGMELELTHCPACGLPAEVFDRFVVFGERGPIEHVMVRCLTGRSYERRVGRWIPGARLQPGAAADEGV